MRDSNYRSIANNRAAVTITTSLYDRRALDVTADKPLVNSLNHLTYLVSSSAKVRETLANDGGIERLVEILHECHNGAPNAARGFFVGERKLLTAWKWTLAFQCLVLIGTRGTEKIRQKVVRAGILPVIATVLDNYMSLHESNFSATCGGPSPQNTHYTPQHSHSHAYPPAAPASEHHTDAPRAAQTVTFMNIRFPVNQAPEAPIAQIPNTRNTPSAPPDFDPAAMHDAQNSPVSRTQLMNNDVSATSFDTCDRRAQCAFLQNNYVNSLTSEDYDTLSVDQLLKLVRGNFDLAQGNPNSSRSSVNNDIRRKYLIISIIKKLREHKENEMVYHYGMGDCDYDMDNNLHFLANLYSQDEKTVHLFDAMHSKIAPRDFTESGAVIPKDDDVVWCLQLLAYISKYPYLKEVLQNTHLVSDLSIRDRQMRVTRRQLKPKSRTQLSSTLQDTIQPISRQNRDFTPTENPYTAAGGDSRNFMGDLNSSLSTSLNMIDLSMRNANFELTEDNLDLYNKPEDHGLTEDAEANDFDDDLDDFDDDSDHRSKDKEEVDDYLSNFEESVTVSAQSASFLSRLYDSIINAESIVDDLDRELALFRLSDKVNEYIKAECERLSNAIVEKRFEQKEYLTKTWNYDTYDNFDIDEGDIKGDGDFDESLIEFKEVNLFPIVEKFTFLVGTDMSYWSGVIMRNSCRRNDLKGGVRQCGNLECGKWEKYPREFSKCKRCKRTKYCSRECQMRAWHCHKNWCVPSNSSSSTHTGHSANTAADVQHERTTNVSAATSDSEPLVSNAGDLSRHVSSEDQEA